MSKKSYESPKLTVLGSVSALTRGGSTMGSDTENNSMQMSVAK